MNTVDTHLKRYLIEEGVRRFFYRFGDVKHAVAALQPVAVAALGSRQRPGRRAEEGGGWRDNAR